MSSNKVSKAYFRKYYLVTWAHIYALVGVWVASVLFGLCLGAYIGDLPQTERLLGESQIAVFELNLSHNIIDVHLDQA